MIGIILCTHSEMAAGIKKSVEMIMGEQKDFEVLGFFNGDNQEDLGEQIINRVRNFRKKGFTPCILVDLLGATPFNVSLAKLIGDEAYIITGVNLPLILEILMERIDLTDSDVGEALQKALNTAKNGMNIFETKKL